MILITISTSANNGQPGNESAYFLLAFIVLIIVLRIRKMGRTRNFRPQRLAMIIILYSLLAYTSLIGAPTLGGYLYYMLVLALICGIIIGVQIAEKIEIKYVSGRITYERPYILSILFLVLFIAREITFLIATQSWVFSYIAIAIFVSLGLVAGEAVTIFKKGSSNKVEPADTA